MDIKSSSNHEHIFQGRYHRYLSVKPFDKLESCVLTEIFCGVLCMIVGRRAKLCALPKCCTPISELQLSLFTSPSVLHYSMLWSFSSWELYQLHQNSVLYVSGDCHFFLVHTFVAATLLSSCYSYYFHLIESTTKAKHVTVRPNWWAMGRKIVHLIRNLEDTKT